MYWSKNVNLYTCLNTLDKNVQTTFIFETVHYVPYTGLSFARTATLLKNRLQNGNQQKWTQQHEPTNCSGLKERADNFPNLDIDKIE